MRGVGIEPTRIAPKDLKTFALTTRPSSLRAFRQMVLLGFEPRFWESKSHVLNLLDYSTPRDSSKFYRSFKFWEGIDIQKSILTTVIALIQVRNYIINKRVARRSTKYSKHHFFFFFSNFNFCFRHNKSLKQKKGQAPVEIRRFSMGLLEGALGGDILTGFCCQDLYAIPQQSNSLLQI